MDRRVVLAGMAAAFATPAFAQTSPSTSTAAGAAMGQAEQEWMHKTMTVGSVALRTSEIALEKGRNKEVKQFAKFEADEQKGIAEVLQSMMEPAATGSTAKPEMDAKGQDVVHKLEQAKVGAAFDKDYVMGQIEGHKELLQVQNVVGGIKDAIKGK